ncbi:hypothetical protein HHK36_019869 [Tetracentron sinense]|uniref:Citrate synthase n=1 Tax=Tetracentron sinense TaxID=13715 RepID=A0A835DD58_TETSI|nr:hypothetical protein HHK36_019869 [Tetracentron sinense]
MGDSREIAISAQAKSSNRLKLPSQREAVPYQGNLTIREGNSGINSFNSWIMALMGMKGEEMGLVLERLKKLKAEHGKAQFGNITVDMVIGGMRGMTGLLWETSLLDPDEGIRFRGLSIPECQKVLPAAKPEGQPLPEGLLWLLLTGKVPSKEQVDVLSKELRIRATVPGFVA